MAVGIGVGEESGLQNGIGRGLDTRNQVRGRERGLSIVQSSAREFETTAVRFAYLLNLSEVVLRVLVQDHGTDGTQRELGVRPDLCEIQHVVAELLSLLSSHGLLQLRVT